MHWEEQHKSKYWGTYPEIDLVRKAKHHISLIARHGDVRPKCLDLGCGTGANSIMLAECGYDVLAIDGSPTAISRLEKRITSGDKGRYIQCRVLEFEQLHVLQNCFTFVVDNLAIYANTIDEISNYLSYIKKLMEPKGIFYSRVWGKKTSGLSATGQYFYSNPAEGPCKDTGKTTVYDRALIQQLYGSLFQIQVDEIETTYNDGTIWHEYIVQSRT